MLKVDVFLNYHPQDICYYVIFIPLFNVYTLDVLCELNLWLKIKTREEVVLSCNNNVINLKIN